MTSELTIIMPTRNRPHNVTRAIDAWQETQAFDVAQLYVAIDRDDPHYDGYMRIPAHPRVKFVEFDKWQPMVPKLNRTAVTCATWATGFQGDDHVPRTRQWAQLYLAELERMRTAVVHGNDLHRGEKLPTEWAMTTNMVHALRRMVPAPVKHLFCDRAIMNVAVALDRLSYLPHVTVEHMHCVMGKATRDAQYRRVNRRSQFLADRKRYRKWRKEQMRIDVKTLKEKCYG